MHRSPAGREARRAGDPGALRRDEGLHARVHSRSDLLARRSRVAKAQKSGKGKDAAKAKAAKKAARVATVEAEANAELDATNGAAPLDPGPALGTEPARV